MNSDRPLFALFGNTFKSYKTHYVERLIRVLREYSVRIAVYRNYYRFLTESMHIDLPDVEVFDTLPDDTAMLLSIGGDGTLLRAASFVADKGTPILGINTGRLGYLADVPYEQIEQTIRLIAQQAYRLESRKLLKVSCEEQHIVHYPYALNEIAVLKRDISSMIAIHTSVNGEYLTTYQADGLVIATPTGSTAYSLSVGGPIVVPESRSVIISAVAPHSLNMRPILLNDDAEITLEVESRNHNFLVAIDGRSEPLSEGCRLHISKGDYTVQLVKPDNHSFFKTLRSKMMWGADNRQS